MKKLWESVIRFRTWIVNLVLALAVILPDLMNSPEILAVVPAEYQRWIVALAFLINIWLRPRPAVIKTDLEASVSRSKRPGGAA